VLGLLHPTSLVTTRKRQIKHDIKQQADMQANGIAYTHTLQKCKSWW